MRTCKDLNHMERVLAYQLKMSLPNTGTGLRKNSHEFAESKCLLLKNGNTRV